MTRLLSLGIVAVAAIGCAPGGVYVRDHTVETRLEDGFEQGPVRIKVPLHDTLPTQVKVAISARCAPRFNATIGDRALTPAYRWFDSPTELRWQQWLRERVDLNATAPGARTEATPEPSRLREDEEASADMPATAPPQSAVQGFGGVAVDGSGAALSAGAHVGVTLPGHWREVESIEARWLRNYLKAELEICAQLSTWELESDPIDPGTREAELVLWSEWPQLVREGRVTIEVTRIEPPPPPREPGSPPAPGAVWQPGRYEWTHDGTVPAYARWRWVEGHWQRPPDRFRPPPKDDRPWRDFGRPSDDAEWINGHWVWTDGGWEWQSGWWRVPAPPRPPARTAVAHAPAPMPPFSQTPRARTAPEQTAPAKTTAVTAAAVQPPPEPCDDGPPPEPPEELQPEAPAPNAHWIGGSWRHDGCHWVWRPGHYEVPPGPNYVWEPGPTIGVGGRWVLTAP
ncbi:MAG: hypothetical protein IRZ16_11025 [Myxococcaceae bacterium]|nr:hypothetical protein [Myxococcaceae bacterium]